MLLDIETRIGELLPPPEEAQRTASPGAGKERKKREYGFDDHRATHARAIAKHPEIVERVKAQARENEDIPTRTAVINEIRHQTVKSRFEEKIKGKV